MKPKDFLNKYNLGDGWQTKYQRDFLNDLTNELLAACEAAHADDNIKGFEQAVKVLRMKWDAISNKVRFGLPQSLWNYWYATVVVKVREQLCSREVAIRERLKAERKAEYERRQAEREYWDDIFRQDFFDRLAMLYLLASAKPVASFEYFGLTADATAEQVNKAYKLKCKTCHPDTGGTNEAFHELVAHKNKCLKWCETRQAN